MNSIFSIAKIFWRNYIPNIHWPSFMFCFSIMFSLFCFASRKSLSLRVTVWNVMYSVYGTLIVVLTFLGRSIGSVHSSWRSLFSTYNAWFVQGKYWVGYEVLFNIMLFIPLGCVLKHKNVENRKAILAILAVTVCIETVQLLTGTGLFEICDLIDNTLGGIIGIGLAILIQKAKKFLII